MLMLLWELFKKQTKKVVKLELDKINRDIATGGDKLGVAYSIVDLNLQTNKNTIYTASIDLIIFTIYCYILQ